MQVSSSCSSSSTMVVPRAAGKRPLWCRLTMRKSNQLDLVVLMETGGRGRGRGGKGGTSGGPWTWGWRYYAMALVQIVSWGVMLVHALAFLNGNISGGSGDARQLDYRGALEKSLKFFEAQRSGKLPPSQRVTWRGDSGMSDGLAQDIDLTGGYYDAGDNVKYGLPMAFAVTMLSWNVIEYGRELQSAGERAHALEAIKWGTDYFIKAHPEPEVLWGEVGDGDSDHYCWMKPEHMTTSRTAYKIEAAHPGSDLAGETAAAMAAASIVFQASDPKYAATLLTHARQLFAFADTHRGAYDESIPITRRYYRSWSGYHDELLWAALWLYDATNETQFLAYVVENADALGGAGWALDLFSWDNKYVGVQLKATKVLLDGNVEPQHEEVLQRYQAKAEYFLCAALQKNHGKQLTKSPDGMFWTQHWNNMQYVSSAAFLLSIASDYYTRSQRAPSRCTAEVIPGELLQAARQQVDYVLGRNSRGMSYMVGFGERFPRRVHHRGASIPGPVACRRGYSQFYLVPEANPFVLEGAVVGGPDENDVYLDVRENYAMAEPALYNTAPLVGLLARFASEVGRGSLPPAPATSGTVATPAQLLLSRHSLRHTNRKIRVSSQTPPAAVTLGEEAVAVAVTQALVEEFVRNEKRVFRFAGEVVNRSERPLRSAHLVTHKLYGALLGLDKVHANGNVYALPAPLQPGQSLNFSYSHSYEMAQLFVHSYELDDAADTS